MRLVAPKSRSFSRGLNLSLRQPWARTGSETGTAEKAAGLVGSAPPPSSTPAVALARQLLPLRVNSLRLTLTKIERMSSLAPPKTSGITAVGWIWAVSGSRKSATLTTTVPRSKGPASAGVTTTSESGAPWKGPAR